MQPWMKEYKVSKEGDENTTNSSNIQPEISDSDVVKTIVGSIGSQDRRGGVLGKTVLLTDDDRHPLLQSAPLAINIFCTEKKT